MTTSHFGLAIEEQMLFTSSGNCVVIGLPYIQIFSNQYKPNRLSLLNATILLFFIFKNFSSIKSLNIDSLILVILLLSKYNS